MMIKNIILRAVFLGASLAAAASAAKGDLFLSAAPALDLVRDPFGVGGVVSLQLGVNEATDFMLDASMLGSFGKGDDEDRSDTRWLLGSFYTPYFGDIRPRFGGSAGIEYITGPKGTGGHALDFDVGFHLQGLYDVSDRMRLFAEVQPNLTIGDMGGFSTMVKFGLLFRLSK